MNPVVVWIVKHILPWLAWAVSLFIPGRKRKLALLEARNKALIMGLVTHVETVFPPRGTYKPLLELVNKCYAMGTFPALWAVEGLGNYYAETFRDRRLPIEKLLTDPTLEVLPAKSLTMLHAGIGLSFAKRSLEGLKVDSSPALLRNALQEFIRLCDGSSRPGYAGAAYESLGLVTLILHSPEMARVLDKHLAEMNPLVAEYMWRGAGRALYFHPKNFIPGIKHPSRGIQICREIAPHDKAFRNLRAGIAWATTVVNMRHPGIMESVLLHQGKEDPDREFFVDGVVSAMIMRYDTSPDDSCISPFIEHQPDRSDPLLCDLWDRDIRKPCRFALDIAYPALIRGNRLEEVFRYKKLVDLVECAATETAAARH
jgi:hypothetical protein